MRPIPNDPRRPAAPVKKSIQAIEELIGQDPAGRNIAPLILPGELERAARELLGARKVLIASGFFVPSAGAGETPIIVVAPAIANAVFHAVGVRVRSMPMGSALAGQLKGS